MPKEKYMSSILISGCGISYSEQQKPTWVNVLKLCGVDVIDAGGPAISNESILNSLLFELDKQENISHVICQLTNPGKIDIEMNDERMAMFEGNNVKANRQFIWKGMWPSSVSYYTTQKKDYYKWIYSSKVDLENTLLKMYLLQTLCEQRNIKLLIVQGYTIPWQESSILNKINFDKKFAIRDLYEASDYYKFHDNTDGNSVPCVEFQKYYAWKINEDFLKFELQHKFEKFKW